MSDRQATVVNYDEPAPQEFKVPSQLPDPTGFRILVSPKQVSDTTAGGIVIPDERRDKENAASIVFGVLKVGPDAYKDQRKFPAGPWCKEGDWVILPAYAGVKIFVKGMEFRIINDDTVQAVVEDPSGVGRA